MNKPYNKLTENEKIVLVKDAISRWKSGDREYQAFNNKYTVALVALSDYYNDPPKFDFPIDPYNPPQEVIEFQERGGMKTPPLEWQDEVIRIVNSLAV